MATRKNSAATHTRLAADIGGTFTDCVAVDENGTVTLGKALSTADDFAVGALNAVADAAPLLIAGDENKFMTKIALQLNPPPEKPARKEAPPKEST